jgi:hypothetical protein
VELSQEFFAHVFIGLHTIADARYLSRLDSRRVAQNCAVLQAKIVQTVEATVKIPAPSRARGIVST